jgi:TetR/AcrR family transcriptional repressor of nem operon
MRVSREQAAENRQRIVETASRMFREHGFDGVGVDAIMNGAGLTHGGFYGHFRSKDDLAAEAMTRALERSAEKQRRYTKLNDLVSDYLSERHCADRARGCALAALGGDIPRQGEGVRGALTAYVRGQLDRFTSLIRNGTAASRRKRAITTLAGMVGALTLARAVDDPALSEEILNVARDAFGGARRAAVLDTHAARGSTLAGE